MKILPLLAALGLGLAGCNSSLTPPKCTNLESPPCRGAWQNYTLNLAMDAADSSKGKYFQIVNFDTIYQCKEEIPDNALISGYPKSCIHYAVPTKVREKVRKDLTEAAANGF